MATNRKTILAKGEAEQEAITEAIKQAKEFAKSATQSNPYHYTVKDKRIRSFSCLAADCRFAGIKCKSAFDGLMIYGLE